MRGSRLGHVVDVAKGIVASLVAMLVWWLVAVRTQEWSPTLTLSWWWVGAGVLLTSSSCLVVWMRARPFERVYEACNEPMEHTVAVT